MDLNEHHQCAAPRRLEHSPIAVSEALNALQDVGLIDRIDAFVRIAPR
jgi:Mn-dependent DtxR family transcriptional regulator